MHTRKFASPRSSAGLGGLLLLLLLAVSCRRGGDDPYRTLGQTIEVRGRIAVTVLDGVRELQAFPRGTPQEIARAQAEFDRIDKPLQVELAQLSAAVTEADDKVAEARDGVDELEKAFSLNRVTERRIVGYRTLGDDWNGYWRQPVYKQGWKTCGPDNCGATCGECAEQELCFDGYCRCVPQCDGKACGPDGCGGWCGDCGGGSCREGTCAQIQQAAVPACTPECRPSDLSDSGEAKKGEGTAAPASRSANPYVRVAGRGDVPPVAQLTAWIVLLDQQIRTQDEVLGAIGALASRASEVEAGLPAKQQALSAANDEVKAASAKLKEAQQLAKGGASEPDVVRLLELTQQAKAAADAKVTSLAAELVQDRAEVSRLRKAMGSSAKETAKAQAWRTRLQAERDAYRDHAERISKASQTLAQAERNLAATKADTDRKRTVRLAAVATARDLAKSVLDKLKSPATAVADLPLGGSVGGTGKGEDPRAPEAVNYLRSGSSERSDLLDERLDDYIAQLRANLDRRRDAWSELDAKGREAYPAWVAEDRVIEVHLYHLQGLLDANERLRKIWKSL